MLTAIMARFLFSSRCPDIHRPTTRSSGRDCPLSTGRFTLVTSPGWATIPPLPQIERTSTEQQVEEEEVEEAGLIQIWTTLVPMIHIPKGRRTSLGIWTAT